MRLCAGAPASSTQTAPRPSATTLCTQTKCSPADSSSLRALRQAFHSSFGYALIVPSFATSATETGESSVQRGKLTKIRPSSENGDASHLMGEVGDFFDTRSCCLGPRGDGRRQERTSGQSGGGQKGKGALHRDLVRKPLPRRLMLITERNDRAELIVRHRSGNASFVRRLTTSRWGKRRGWACGCGIGPDRTMRASGLTSSSGERTTKTTSEPMASACVLFQTKETTMSNTINPPGQDLPEPILPGQEGNDAIGRPMAVRELGTICRPNRSEPIRPASRIRRGPVHLCPAFLAAFERNGDVEGFSVGDAPGFSKFDIGRASSRCVRRHGAPITSGARRPDCRRPRMRCSASHQRLSSPERTRRTGLEISSGRICEGHDRNARGQRDLFGARWIGQRQFPTRHALYRVRNRGVGHRRVLAGDPKGNCPRWHPSTPPGRSVLPARRPCHLRRAAFAAPT